MAEGGGIDKERVSISDVVKSHKKYGSIMNNTKNCKNDLLIKHVVNSGETLQGLALRYGVTMEQIRRANKIWANESLFLRETLLIPVHNSPNDFYSNSTSPNNGTNQLIVEEDRLPSTSSRLCQSDVDHRLIEGSECDKSNQSIADILIRIDTSIARTRNQVEQREKLQDHHQFPDDGLPRVKHRHCQHQSRMRQSLQSPPSPESYQGFTGESKVTVQPITMAQGKRVQSSLQRLQREQDEMFEL